ncbi:pentatricopeptide repeat-containing protein At2g21090 [Punica granatum]|uniref:Pentatricopeptide repeat-containing protein At2g21090 n=1 Tax=Punica granatum TaxID=22663 RepID=A0A218XG94_PUNGR|nr:pentatricopeptide repeat-containing protein At2g21090 [Punica granatum]OWM83944.1 hypothetical protein CDL15_Pgr004375 [Punica granatum]
MVASLSKSRSSRSLPCVARSLLQLSSRGRLSEALDFLPRLSDTGIRLPTNTLAFLISRCTTLKQAKWIHLHLKLTGLKKPNTLLANHLIEAYFRCGSEFLGRKVFDEMASRNLYSWNNVLSGYAKLGRMRPARKLFDRMPERDIVSWNTMLIGYAKAGDCGEALRLYKEFLKLGMRPSKFSFAGLLTICVKLREVGLARQVHGQVLLLGYSLNIVLLSSIVDAYTKCGEMTDARRVFDEMEVKDVPAWTTLVSGYARSGDINRASEIFHEMPVKNPISWTAMIAGYVRNGLSNRALELFTKMMALRILPDQFTFSSCLCACATLADLKHGKQIHAHLIRTNFRANTIVVGSLVDMYSKCGNLSYAQLIFDRVNDKKEVILWNTMMSALSQHGLGKSAIEMLNSMIGSGVKPDRITFVVLLSACSHSGLVAEAVRLFESMARDHQVFPDQEHYACFIDLLGRAGLFHEVVHQLKKMPIKPDDRVLNSLLGVCKIHSNVALGEEVAEHLMKLQPSSSAAYVFLSSVYAALGRWDSVAKVKKLMNDRSVRKERAISWLESGDEVHSFTVSDVSHPMKEEIYAVLDHITGHVDEEDES